MALYNIKNKKIVWATTRSRGLEDAKIRIGDLAKQVNLLLKKKDKIKVLEIGCGYGHALLDLKKIFGDKISISGTNLEKRWTVNIVKKFALNQKIFTKVNVDENLPKIYLLDAGKKLPFKDNSFDLIFSQATVQYIANKALFLEEVNRILTKEGIACLDLCDYLNREYITPYFRNSIEIWEEGKPLSVWDYLKRFKNLRRITIKNRSYLEMRKSKKFNLKLRLISAINLKNDICDKWHLAVKSVFTKI